MTSSPIPMKVYAETGLVDVPTVNALLAYGQPMLTERIDPWHPYGRSYRAWIRLRSGGRTFGRVYLSPQLAAESLLRKLRGVGR